MDKALELLDAVMDPIESHVLGFGATLFDGVVGYSIGAFVVRLDGHRRLRISKIFQSGAEAACFLRIVE
jgi:hypothetical protein